MVDFALGRLGTCGFEPTFFKPFPSRGAINTKSRPVLFTPLLSYWQGPERGFVNSGAKAAQAYLPCLLAIDGQSPNNRRLLVQANEPRWELSTDDRAAPSRGVSLQTMRRKIRQRSWCLRLGLGDQTHKGSRDGSSAHSCSATRVRSDRIFDCTAVASSLVAKRCAWFGLLHQSPSSQ
jgi:hypothetical protein